MIVFVANRVLWTVPVLLLAVLLTFGLMKAMPGGPFDGNRLIATNPTLRASLERKWGLDKPWYVQYARYVIHAARGDFGESMKLQTKSVRDIIGATLPTSMLLGVLAFSFSMFIGTLVGVACALRANSYMDYGLTVASTAFFAIPTFITATYWVAYLPSYYGWDDWFERLGPITVLGLAIMPYFTRLVRASMLETLNEDFVTTARAKGLPWRRTVFRHVLRNSMIPVVTNAGPLFGFVITGSFIIEYIMYVPGIAQEFVTSLQGDPRDQTMVLGTTVVLATIIVLVNLAVDIVIGYLDPRIAHD